MKDIKTRMTAGKEEVLNLLTNSYQSLTPIMQTLKIQWYQAKLIVTELIADGKVESAVCGKRIRYRKKIETVVN